MFFEKRLRWKVTGNWKKKIFFVFFWNFHSLLVQHTKETRRVKVESGHGTLNCSFHIIIKTNLYSRTHTHTHIYTRTWSEIVFDTVQSLRQCSHQAEISRIHIPWIWSYYNVADVNTLSSCYLSFSSSSSLDLFAVVRACRKAQASQSVALSLQAHTHTNTQK